LIGRRACARGQAQTLACLVVHTLAVLETCAAQRPGCIGRWVALKYCFGGLWFRSRACL